MKIRGLVLGATVVMLSTVTMIGAGLHLKDQPFFQDSPKELVDEVWQIIDKNYVDASFNQVDWQETRNEYLNRAYTNNEEAYVAIREMLEKLDDPYTRFMNPEEFRNMQIDTSGELTGVGIQLSQDKETKKLIVSSSIENTPADQVGIKAKDEIIEIDGKSTEGMNINDAVNLIRGQVDTPVMLKIRRDDKETLEFTMIRAQIEIHPVKYMNQDQGNAVGYIRLTSFSANAAEEMQDAIESLEEQDVAGYILDLRSNPGGLLNSSIEIAKMWIEDGTIVSTVNRQGVSDEQRADRKSLTDKPLVVLIDDGSASASEILASALQDNDRAVLVGTQTFGKGSVQSVRPLGDGSGLAVTIAKHLTPNGRNIDKEGIAPDFVVEEQREKLWVDRTSMGTMQDPQYAKAIEILTQKIVSQSTNSVKYLN